MAQLAAPTRAAGKKAWNPRVGHVLYSIILTGMGARAIYAMPAPPRGASSPRGLSFTNDNRSHSAVITEVYYAITH